MSLTFRDDTFTIVQLTDLHWHNGEDADKKTRRLMEQVLDAEQPDLVVLTGDVISGSGCRDPRQSWFDAVQPIEDRNLPWAAVLGNHDDEGTFDRAALMEVQLECARCLSQPGPEDVTGTGNYALDVRHQGEVVWTLYFMDTLAYAWTKIGGYAWVRPDQIAWFRALAKERQKTHGDIPALAFFHIPIPEYAEVWRNGGCVGEKHEQICCPRVNSGLFAAFHEAGDVVATFCGHDHVNDFEGMHWGVRLCYGRASGFNTYGKEGFSRGARVIRLAPDRRDIESWLRLEGGVRINRLL